MHDPASLELLQEPLPANVDINELLTALHPALPTPDALVRHPVGGAAPTPDYLTRLIGEVHLTRNTLVRRLLGEIDPAPDDLAPHLIGEVHLTPDALVRHLIGEVHLTPDNPAPHLIEETDTPPATLIPFRIKGLVCHTPNPMGGGWDLRIIAVASRTKVIPSGVQESRAKVALVGVITQTAL
jgi:hypothetical protein